MSRVAVFIDGFNFYHGLRAKHGRRYLWLDLAEVARRLLEPDDTLVAVHYFTAAVRNGVTSQANQRVYLAALEAHGGVTVTFGRYQERLVTCRACGASWPAFEEKETDVNIAVALLSGAARDTYDTAVLISADGDLGPGVRALKVLRPDKRVVAVFPPRRTSGDLRRAVDASFTIGDAVLRQSLLPDVVRGAGGVEHHRPARWH